jgi:ParB-like chromosome segregation protein Spo0J
MADFSEWSTPRISIMKLLLDSSNPRLSEPGELAASQGDIIAELVSHEKVESLAKSISANGYFPNEAPFVIKAQDYYIVVEGNRRIAACKVLLNPQAAPDSAKARFQKLATGSGVSSLKKLRVIVAPDREAIIPIIIARHTEAQIEQWDPLMKARFYASRMKAGWTLAEGAAELKIAQSDLARHLHRHNAYLAACSLPLTDDVLGQVRDPRRFNITTLERLYENKDVRDFLGVSFNDRGELEGHIALAEFQKGFVRIVTDIISNTVHSRTTDKTEDVKNYLGSIPHKSRPDRNVKGRFDMATILASARPVVPQKKPAAKPKPPRPKSKSLIPHGFHCTSTSTRVCDVFDELHRLPIDNFPNASAVLFRALLEMSLYNFLKSKGEIQKLKAAVSKGKALPRDWAPGVQQMLGYLKSNTNLLSDPHVIKALSRFKHDVISFNLFVHNSAYHPDRTKLNTLWKDAEGLLRELWQ